MNSLTRARALRAAAKLAVGVSVGACGRPEIAAPPGEHEYDADRPVEAFADHVTVADASIADSSVVVAIREAPSSQARCTLTHVDGGLANDSVNCCLQLVARKTPEDAGFSKNLAAVKNDPAVLSCCKALYDNGRPGLVSYVYGKARWPLQSCEACADAVGQAGACTPWGPAVPPAMLEAA